MLVLQIEALECTQMQGESADFPKFSGGEPQTPTKARASGASRWPAVTATILTPPKSSIAPSKVWTWLRAPIEATEEDAGEVSENCAVVRIAGPWNKRQSVNFNAFR